MRLIVLVENTAGNKCMAEHGLSFLIEADKNVLFDTGASKLFIKNARMLSINLDEVKTVVLSHGHDDHTGGLPFISDKQIICHPDVFAKRYRKVNKTPLHIPVSFDGLSEKNEIICSKAPLEISEQIIFLGEIPRLNDFEAKETGFLFEDGTDDFVMDDSGLAIKTEKGLVIVSGCAHSGICNMVEHAIKVTGIKKVHAVIGGFHLKKNDETTRRTIAFLKAKNVQQVNPSHCTMFPALTAFYNEFPFIQLKTGNIITI